MRKLLLTTAAVAAICLAGCGSGTLTDKRDGQKYRTVVINGKRWMAENLNYKTDSSWCYENSADSCKKYGRLYDWNTATAACPRGWHLPSNNEWTELYSFAAVSSKAYNALKSKSGWDENGNGADDFGFSALPGGFRSPDGSFGNAGSDGLWWTATESDSDSAYYRLIHYIGNCVYVAAHYKSRGRSVRCVAGIP